MTVAEKWLTMMLLCLSGSTIYWMPFFSEIYYVPMQDAFGFSNTQTGRSIKYFWIYVADWLFPGWVVSGSLFITQTHICRPGDYGGGCVRILDDAVIRGYVCFCSACGE